MNTVLFIRRGHKAAICLRDDMLVEIAGGAGYSLKGDFTGVTEIVLVNKMMYDKLLELAPGTPDPPAEETKAGGTD